MLTEDQRNILKIKLDSNGMGESEIKEVLKALDSLVENTPQLSDEDCARIVKQLTEELQERFGKSQKLNHSAFKDKLKSIVSEIVVGLVTTGVWEILIYVFHHVTFHMATQGEDWRAEDVARASAFKPTQSMSPDDVDTLARIKELLYAWQVEYFEVISAQIKNDENYIPIAQAVADYFQWDEHTMEIFFYQWMIQVAHYTLMKEGSKLLLENRERWKQQQGRP